MSPPHAAGRAVAPSIGWISCCSSQIKMNHKICTYSCCQFLLHPLRTALLFRFNRPILVALVSYHSLNYNNNYNYSWLGGEVGFLHIITVCMCGIDSLFPEGTHKVTKRSEGIRRKIKGEWKEKRVNAETASHCGLNYCLNSNSVCSNSRFNPS